MKNLEIMSLYQNKYRIESARLKNWDYNRHAFYFITICTKNQIPFFGQIERGTMQLSEIGEIANQAWQATSALRPDMNLELGHFVVMPNHFHAILLIGENEYNTDTALSNNKDASYQNQFDSQSKNLASIVRGFKAKVTSKAWKINPNFAWQPRYHDHIIRNEQALEKISNYIQNNPLLWKQDKFYNPRL